MTAVEVYELTSQGGATDFADIVKVCGSLGPYCLIGGLAVNCYVEPVYTMDADLVVVPSHLADLPLRLADAGFKVERFAHSINAQRGDSRLRIQFTTDTRYERFPTRATLRTVLGESVSVAAVGDVFQGKLWAWSDPSRRLTKRKKDELDLIRLAEAFPVLRPGLPGELRALLEN
jgi:hypothetical protein